MDDKLRVQFTRIKNIIFVQFLNIPMQYHSWGVIAQLDDDQGGEWYIKNTGQAGIGGGTLYVPTRDIFYSSHCSTKSYPYSYFSESVAKQAVAMFSKLIHNINMREEVSNQ